MLGMPQKSHVLTASPDEFIVGTITVSKPAMSPVVPPISHVSHANLGLQYT
jgi:hypothetical protein